MSHLVVLLSLLLKHYILIIQTIIVIKSMDIKKETMMNTITDLLLLLQLISTKIIHHKGK